MVSSDRYSRQIVVPEIGALGQEKISKTSVLISGDPSIGEAAKVYLAAAGFRSVGFSTDPSIENGHVRFVAGEERVEVRVSAGKVVVNDDGSFEVAASAPGQGDLFAGGMLGAVELIKAVVGIDSGGSWSVNV